MVYLSYKNAPEWWIKENSSKSHAALRTHRKKHAYNERQRLRKLWKQRRKDFQFIRRHNKDPKRELRKKYSHEKSYPLYFARKILKYENPYDENKSKYDKYLLSAYIDRAKKSTRRKRWRK